MIDCIGVVYNEIRTELSWSIEQDVVYHEEKEDNDVMDKKGVICVEYNIELSKPIRKCAVYEKMG